MTDSKDTATNTEAAATAATTAAFDNKQAAGAEAVTEQAHGGDGNGNPNAGHGRCGGHGPGRGNWQDKRRLKMIGAVVLIALVGFMLGRGSAHHRGHHMEGHYGKPHQQMEFARGEQALPSLSTILDGIAATPEQRSKAVELFR